MRTPLGTEHRLEIAEREQRALEYEVDRLRADKAELVAALDASVEEIVRDVAELPDRTSPEDRPDMMLVTADELTKIIRAALAKAKEKS